MELTANHSVKAHRIVLRDYASFTWFLFSGAMLVLTLVGLVVTGISLVEGAEDIGAMLLAQFVSLLLLALPIWLLRKRYQFVKHVLEQGNLTNGTVTRVRGIGSERRVHYGYQVDSKAYNTRNVIIIYGFRSPERKGSNVQIAYNPDNPAHAFITSLYY